MGMSAWGLLAAPLLAHSPAPATTIQEPAIVSADAFGGLATLDETAMSKASGGADTAIDVGQIGINLAENKGVVTDISLNNSTTGDASGNLVNDNHGITTVFFNTGNGVVFQSNVNVNIFTNTGGPQ